MYSECMSINTMGWSKDGEEGRDRGPVTTRKLMQTDTITRTVGRRRVRKRMDGGGIWRGGWEMTDVYGEGY